VFLGEYEHSLDTKGRLVLPRKFRDVLADEPCVVTKGQDDCLYVFSLEQFQHEAAKVQRIPRTVRRGRQYTRAFGAGALDQVPDKQGRIQLPEKLRQFAGLDKDVVVVGALDHIEIWSTDAWSAEAAEADEYYSAIEESLIVDGEI
jgi:MraZ protein